MKAVNIGLIGLGTVGCGTVSVLARNSDEIARRAGREINIVQAAVSDINKPRECDVSALALVDDPFLVVNNPDIDVVVELIGRAGHLKSAGSASHRKWQACRDR